MQTSYKLQVADFSQVIRHNVHKTEVETVCIVDAGGGKEPRRVVKRLVLDVGVVTRTQTISVFRTFKRSRVHYQPHITASDRASLYSQPIAKHIHIYSTFLYEMQLITSNYFTTTQNITTSTKHV